VDSFIGASKDSLIRQWGPPDEKVPDDKGGFFYIYRKDNSLKESFEVNKKGKITGWQWNDPNGKDDMASYVSQVKKLVYSNDLRVSKPEVPSYALKYAPQMGLGWGVTLSPGKHFEACFLTILGVWYLNGFHVTKNAAKAVQYFLLACVFNDSNAQLDLANCYRHGWGTKVDLKQARTFYQFAANQGNQEAKDALKEMDTPSGQR